MKEHTLIKLLEHYYIIVDDSEIKVGDWFYSIPRQTFHKCTAIFENNLIDNNWESIKEVEICKSDCKKISHSFGSELKGVENRPLSEAQELTLGYSVEKMAEKYAFDFIEDKDLIELQIAAYLEGINTYKELVKDKLFTVEEVLSIIDEIGFLQTTTDELNSKDYQPFITDEDGGVWTINKQHIQNYIQSLLPKTEWDVEFDEQGKMKLITK